MFDKIMEALSGKGLVAIGFDAWNALSEVAYNLLTVAPSDAGGGGLWTVSQSLLVVMKLVGAALFTLLFFINFCKKASNIREHRTLEMEIELVIKYIVGIYVTTNIDKIINGMIDIMQALAGELSPGGADSISLQSVTLEDWDNDSAILGLILGFVFMLVCIAAGFMLILTVYGAFFKIYYYIIIAPLALGTIAGPEGAARSAENWLKAFACALFEFVGIIIILRLCAALINSDGFLIPTPDGLLALETAWSIIQSMLIVVITVATVKMTDMLTRRAFGF